MTKRLFSAAAAAIALPIRPFGAIRLMRIGWPAVRMSRRVMAKGGAPRNRTALLVGSVRPSHFLKQHVRAEMAIGGALAAARDPLPRGLREKGVPFLFTLDVFGRRGHMVEDRDQVEVGLTPALVGVRQDVIALDPAFRLLEFHILAILAGEIVRIIGKMA